MKKHIALALTASTLFLVGGCCTNPVNVVVTNPKPLPVVVSNPSTGGYPTGWDYKIIQITGSNPPGVASMFDSMSKDGWEYVTTMPDANTMPNSQSYIWRKAK